MPRHDRRYIPFITAAATIAVLTTAGIIISKNGAGCLEKIAGESTILKTSGFKRPPQQTYQPKEQAIYLEIDTSKRYTFEEIKQEAIEKRKVLVPTPWNNYEIIALIPSDEYKRDNLIGQEVNRQTIFNAIKKGSINAYAVKKGDNLYNPLRGR